MFAERKTAQEIVDILAENNIQITRQAIWRYSQSKKWKPFILRLRRVFEKELTRIPIANKAMRLKLLNQVAEEGLLWNIKGFDARTGRPVYEAKIGATVQACREAREEMKGSDEFEDPLMNEEIGTLYGDVKNPKREFSRFMN